MKKIGFLVLSAVFCFQALGQTTEFYRVGNTFDVKIETQKFGLHGHDIVVSVYRTQEFAIQNSSHPISLAKIKFENVNCQKSINHKSDDSEITFAMTGQLTCTPSYRAYTGVFVPSSFIIESEELEVDAFCSIKNVTEEHRTLLNAYQALPSYNSSNISAYPISSEINWGNNSSKVKTDKTTPKKNK